METVAAAFAMVIIDPLSSSQLLPEQYSYPTGCELGWKLVAYTGNWFHSYVDPSCQLAGATSLETTV
jgi:hypothetical protein